MLKHGVAVAQLEKSQKSWQTDSVMSVIQDNLYNVWYKIMLDRVLK